MDVYYAEKVAQYAQNPEVKGLVYEYVEILKPGVNVGAYTSRNNVLAHQHARLADLLVNLCIQVNLTFQGHVTSSITSFT